MIIMRLAIRNLLGAGLRTWLNVVVLSFSFVVIIWTQGLLIGWDEHASKAMSDVEYGGGQYWQKDYDPYNPLSIEDAHAEIPGALQSLIDSGQVTPILIAQGTIYPGGRIRSVLLKGIDPNQKILSIPSSFLDEKEEDLPALIGSRMAKNTGLKLGDYVAVRWREAGGSFNALDARIVQIMSTTVPSVDNGQIWLPLKKLQAMTRLENEATLAVSGKKTAEVKDIQDWTFRSLNFLLKDIKDLIKTKSIGQSIFYAILFFLGMLAIFDTQVLAIFRRRKEMGTLMALGFTRAKVIQLFTVEGALHGILAAGVAAIYGIPLLTYFSVNGWTLPANTESFGFTVGEKIFPTYSAGLILGTTILVMLVTTVVSFLPTRKIAKLKPTEALRGKLP